MSYDEPKILSSELSKLCLMGADVGHSHSENSYARIIPLTISFLVVMVQLASASLVASRLIQRLKGLL